MLLEKDKRGSVINTNSHQNEGSDLMFSPAALATFTSQTLASAQTSSHEEEDVPKQQEKPNCTRTMGEIGCK